MKNIDIGLKIAIVVLLTWIAFKLDSIEKTIPYLSSSFPVSVRVVQ